MFLEIKNTKINSLISFTFAFLGLCLFLCLGYKLGLFWGFGQKYSVFSYIFTAILFFIVLFFLTLKRKILFIILIPIFFLIIYLLPAQQEPHEVVNDIGAFVDGKHYKFLPTDSNSYSISLSMSHEQLSYLGNILSAELQERLFVQTDISSNEGIIKQITPVALDRSVMRPPDGYPAIFFLLEIPLKKGIEYSIKADLGFLPTNSSVPSYQTPPRLKGLKHAEWFITPVDNNNPVADHISVISNLPSRVTPKIVILSYSWPLGSLIRLKLPYLFLETGGFLVLAGLFYILFALAFVSLTAIPIKHFKD